MFPLHASKYFRPLSASRYGNSLNPLGSPAWRISNPNHKVPQPVSTQSVGSTSFKFVTGTRRHPRINVAVPVKITSHDNSVLPAMACTYEVSLKGCKLANSVGLNTVDQLVWLNRKNRKAMYKVVWTSHNKNQVGLQIAESEKLIWDDELVGKLS